ncbi:Ig-like domain-containing protein [Vibrio lentus]|nr:Ig-like domain-containing protein [Vibrio lentus]
MMMVASLLFQIRTLMVTRDYPNITDGTRHGSSDSGPTVNPVIDLPVPQDQQFSIEEDGTLQFTDADLLTGATDIDGDDLP